MCYVVINDVYWKSLFEVKPAQCLMAHQLGLLEVKMLWKLGELASYKEH